MISVVGYLSDFMSCCNGHSHVRKHDLEDFWFPEACNLNNDGTCIKNLFPPKILLIYLQIALKVVN